MEDHPVFPKNVCKNLLFLPADNEYSQRDFIYLFCTCMGWLEYCVEIYYMYLEINY